MQPDLHNGILEGACMIELRTLDEFRDRRVAAVACAIQTNDCRN